MKEIKENKHKLFCLSEELSNMIVIMWTQQNADERIEMLVNNENSDRDDGLIQQDNSYV